MGVVRRTVSKHAAPLRRTATDAEQALWFELRARRLGRHEFRRQWTLHPYIVDFCCLEQRLIVEIDGGQHTAARDAGRTAALKAQDFRILRFWNNDVLGNMDGVLTLLLDALGGPLSPKDPHPTLSRERETAKPGDGAAFPLPLAGEG
jgi:adenine-specific DNA-methyltransferase